MTSLVFNQDFLLWFALPSSSTFSSSTKECIPSLHLLLLLVVDFLLKLFEFFSGEKLHRRCVHAVPLSCWFWSVFKDVSQVCPRLGVHNLHARHKRNGSVHLLHHVVGGNGSEERRPTCPTVKLCSRVKERQTSHGTDVHPVCLVVVRETIRGLAREGTLRCTLLFYTQKNKNKNKNKRRRRRRRRKGKTKTKG